MVRKTGLAIAVAALVAGQAQAESPIQAMFPGKLGCYARSYSDAHLAKHTEQLVTDIALIADPMVADPMLGLWIELDLRGDIAGSYEGFGYCENAGDGLSCGIEGDGGNFTVTPREDGAILLEVGKHGMSFEAEVDYITLMPDRGDDRSFLLQPAPCH